MNRAEDICTVKNQMLAALKTGAQEAYVKDAEAYRLLLLDATGDDLFLAAYHLAASGRLSFCKNYDAVRQDKAMAPDPQAWLARFDELFKAISK